MGAIAAQLEIEGLTPYIASWSAVRIPGFIPAVLNRWWRNKGELPTRFSMVICPQAMAEAERYFPELLSHVETLLDKHSLSDPDLVVRMTGCPNGCARPFVAEIGLVGKGPGRYNLLPGGDGRGKRLNKLYRENLDEQGMLKAIDDLLKKFSAERLGKERLGDFAIRHGIIDEVIKPAVDFHA